MDYLLLVALMEKINCIQKYKPVCAHHGMVHESIYKNKYIIQKN